MPPYRICRALVVVPRPPRAGRRGGAPRGQSRSRGRREGNGTWNMKLNNKVLCRRRGVIAPTATPTRRVPRDQAPGITSNIHPRPSGYGLRTRRGLGRRG